MMKRIRLISLLLVVIAMICTMVGCGSSESKKTPEGWTFECVTEGGEVVPGATLQICTDEMCQMVKCDENGKGSFDPGADAQPEYELHVQKAPLGYEVVGDVPEAITADNKNITITFKKQ